MTRLVVVTCGKRKRDRPAPARLLYQGSYFRAAWTWALSVRHLVDRLMIVSALHGLVDPDLVLAPYEMRMGEPGSVTTETLRHQAALAGLLNADDVTVVAAVDYLAALRGVWPRLRAPFSTLPDARIGYQLQALAAERGRIP